jgi:hypothetical protein
VKLVAGWAVLLLVTVSYRESPRAPAAAAAPGPVALVLPAVSSAISPEELTAVVQRYCQVCHNDQLLTGNLSLEGFDVADPVARAETAEKVIQKLRARMMPPPGAPRPGGDTLLSLVQTLEETLDRAAAAHPNPGSRTFQRLNRAEYESSVRDLLDLQVDAGEYLPLDAKSANFDNIADVQTLSPTLLDAYLRAATAISRLAVGAETLVPSETQIQVSRWASQVDRVEGAPFGTRGGASVMHNFPADGEYVFKVQFHNETTGTLFGDGRSALHTAERPEQLEISIDGDPVALLEIDRWMNVEDVTDGPTGVSMRTEPIIVRAGPHRLTAAFLTRYEGPLEDMISPHEWSIASTAIAGEYGTQAVPHLRDLVVAGPYHATGVSDTPARRKIFTCRPLAPPEARPCAEQILARLATTAFRRPVTAEALSALMSFYDQGAADGGFELGIRSGLEAILASPHFVFRVEEWTGKPGQSARIGDADLASRLSYFLWATPPDAELRSLADQGKLSDDDVLEAQVRRMLADPRSEALSTRFVTQWLHLPDLNSINPDVRFYPDFHQQLRDAMTKETQVFFDHLVKEDRSVLELFTADYTFVNERLAKHYGFLGVVGERFRRVPYPDGRRRGILGHASVLTLTSMPARTSPVLRGKYVMEVILGTPPPPPPPGVPDLEQTSGTLAGRALTTRERMEQHRKATVCNSCHRFMDPLGLALDNFDATGKWRIRENGAHLDTRGELYDGSPVSSPTDLHDALLRLQIPVLRTFTRNLMAYALGRRVEYYDMPTIRAIVDRAQTHDYPMSDFILGVAMSDAFRMRLPAAVDVTEVSQSGLPR